MHCTYKKMNFAQFTTIFSNILDVLNFYTIVFIWPLFVFFFFKYLSTISLRWMIPKEIGSHEWTYQNEVQ